MERVTEMFGSMVFNDVVMQERLPRDVYKALRRAASRGERLAPEVADVAANAMMQWAVELGATHFTHWFQPMTGITAGKHESFISAHNNGRVIMEFSGKELIQGEPDASSLPSGGLRSTFEARGYTVWDTSSYAFIKDTTLYIPTAFCSYSGDALDKKTPLLRSMEALNKQALRVLRLFGNESARRVIPMAGAEQEYFLIDKQAYLKRPDLTYTGRTVLGARPPKGQELDDHYFGTLKPRVAAFMKELERELWKLGVKAKAKHNESAPAQHEFAPIFTTTNIATDHNQLTMELMKTTADKHGLACLLHEKPFEGVNGSGKHNNWSMATDTGVNLLEPGETPQDNAQFLLFLTAVIKAVDDYQDIIRYKVASAGNDHRLGALEAPPAIVSIFLGDLLTDILEAIEQGTDYKGTASAKMDIGVTVLPQFPKDISDRNRTSPFAFTGNKFEFRMVGSSFSIAGPNIALNTAVAEVLGQFADTLERAEDFKPALSQLIRNTITNHKRIIYNGNNYTEEWAEEAARRGLSNLRTAVDAFPAIVSQKSIDLFGKHDVLSESELRSRYEVILENYCKTIHIEASVLQNIVTTHIIPAVIAYQNELAELLQRKSSLSSTYSIELEKQMLYDISNTCSSLSENLRRLSRLRHPNSDDRYADAVFCRDRILTAMSELRGTADALETLVARKYWPLPTYAELLYSVV